MTELQDLQQCYEQNLVGRVFQYGLANGTVLDVIFYREAFCHLLGIQHVTKNRRYIGKSGYERIYSGKLTIETLKGIYRAGYAKIKKRMKYFSLIGHLMDHGDVFRFYPERTGGTRIQATFLIHEKERELERRIVKPSATLLKNEPQMTGRIFFGRGEMNKQDMICA